MPREGHEAKGRRYAVEGRLTVTRVQGFDVSAICRGAGAWHRLGYHPGAGWWCSCPARSRCAHLFALQLVVTVDREGS